MAAAGDEQLGPDATDRRAAVLRSAVATFARFGYRRTSMEEVARAADISRPGLYFLFESKARLFRAAVTQTIEQDLADAERVLADTEVPLRARLVTAFDHWAGRYVEAPARDVAAVIDADPGLLGDVTQTAPRRFEALVTDAVAAEAPRDAAAVAQALVSVSVGLKHQVADRDAYRDRFRAAVDVLLRDP